MVCRVTADHFGGELVELAERYEGREDTERQGCRSDP